MPRPSPDAVIRGDGRAYMNHPFGDDAEDAPPRRWSRAEVEALAQAEPALSPWRVIAAQVLFGSAVAAVVWLLAGATAAFPNASVHVSAAELAFWTDDGNASRAPEWRAGNEVRAIREKQRPAAAK